MKKLIKIVLSLTLMTVLINDSNVFADKKIVLNNKNISKTKKVDKKELAFDFRKTRWGMNFLQVQASENSNPVSTTSDVMVYKDKMLDNDVDIEYYFENNKLFKAAFIFGSSFINKQENIIYYQKIKEGVKAKYGRPSADNSKELDIMDENQYKHMAELLERGVNDYETIWTLPNTKIKLILKGKDMFSKLRLELGYISRKYKSIDKVKEIDKSQF